jgi:hypothetical protein
VTARRADRHFFLASLGRAHCPILHEASQQSARTVESPFI